MRQPIHRVSIVIVSLLLLMSASAFLTYAGGGKKVKELEGKLEACEAKSEQVQQENTALKSKVDLFTAQVSDLEAEIAALDERIAELEAELADKDAQIEALLSESGDVTVVSQQRLQMQDAEILELKEERDALEEENDGLRRELNQAKMDLADMEGRAGYDVEELDALSAENEELAYRIAELEDEKAELQSQVEQLTMERDELEAALAVYEGIERDSKILMETAFERIKEILADEIEEGTVEVFKGALGIVVDVHGEYMFDVGKVEINKGGRIILEKITPILVELDGYFVGVVGNADNKPIVTPALKKRFGTNWELSAHRGAVVVRYLIEKGNLPPSKMIAMGFGEYQPIEDNETIEGRGKNRRIDIVLMPVDVFAAVVIGTQIR